MNRTAINTSKPTDAFERAAMLAGDAPVAGVDEAGRGPWAGPVVAAAVILDPDNVPAGLNDSKALSETARVRAHQAIVASADVGIGISDVDVIDAANILKATDRAMCAAVAQLRVAPRQLLIDGNRVPPEIAIAAQCLVKGDSRSLSIAAASIVAKATRDRMMMALAERYPAYGFEQHKGYGTAAHRAALAEHGPCPVHRRSFRPIRALLADVLSA